MNGDDLEARVRGWLADSVREPAPPDLIDRALAETRATPQRRSWWSMAGKRPLMALAAAAVLILAVVAGLQLGRFSNRDTAAQPSRTPSATATPSGSAEPAASATPAETPTATAPEPDRSTAPTATFAPGTAVRIAADGVNVRREPGLDGESMATFATGDAMVVLSGPEPADGFDWYEVAGGGVLGWTAAGDAEGAWLTPIGADDPAGTLVTLAELGHITPPYLQPAVVVLTDGRFITTDPGDASDPATHLSVRHLSAQGLVALAREVFGGGLFEQQPPSPEQRPGADPAGFGAGRYVFTMYREGAPLERISVETAPFDPESWIVPDELYELEALATMLYERADHLPETAWRDAAASPYEPPAFLVLTQAWRDYPPDPALPADVDEIAWPVDGPIEEFGQPVTLAGEGPYEERCGVVDPATAMELLSAAANGGVAVEPRLDQSFVSIYLDWERESGQFVVQLLAVFESHEPSCANGMLIE